MNFGEAIGSAYANVFNYKGRAGRAEFWWFALFTFVISAVAIAVIGLTGTVGIVVAIVALVAVYLPYISAVVRRLHDGGSSGWWALITIVRIIGDLVLLYMLTRPSELSINRWGPPPGVDYTRPPPTPVHERLGVPEFSPGGFWCEALNCRMYRVSQDSPMCVACGTETMTGDKWAKLKGLSRR